MNDERTTSELRKWNNLPATLNYDVLSIIFLACRDSDSDYEQCSRISFTEGPLKLSWVNRHWRELALTFQSLWTGISLGNGQIEPSQMDIELMKMFIHRSGTSLPLQFRLRYGNNIDVHSQTGPRDTELHVSKMHQVIEILGPTYSRWKAISLHVFNLEALEGLFVWFNNGAIKLEHIEITTQATTFRGEQCPLNFILCPQLQTVKIGCPRLCIQSGFSSYLKLESMMSLDLSYSRSHLDALTWLKCCPNLMNLCLWLYSANNDLEALTKSHLICLPQLQRLSINTYFIDGSGDPSRFLALLILPKLRDLSLSMNNLVYVGPHESWRVVNELLQRSNVLTLQSLEIQGTPMRSQELLEILHDQASLKDLGIDGNLASTSLFRSLADRSRFCPRLEILRLRAYHGSADAIADMIEERYSFIPGAASKSTHNNRSFKTLVLTWCAGQSIVDHPKVRFAMSRGLQVTQTPSQHPLFQRNFTT